jgi:hypothetical protein
MNSHNGGIHHDQIEELLGVYALDALDPEEKVLVERHLEECPRCSAEVAQHLEVAGFLANSGTEAPPQIWDRISEKIGSGEAPDWGKLAARLPKPQVENLSTPVVDQPESSQSGNSAAEESKVIPIERSRRSRLVMRSLSIVAGAAAVLAVFLGIQVNHLNSQVSQLQALSKKPLYNQAVQAALEEPTTRRIPLTPGGTPAGGSEVTIALTSSGRDFVISQNLSGLPSTKTYQLWGEVHGKFVSLGLLGSKPTVIPFVISPNAPVQMFAITAEPTGGVVQPTSSPVVQGTVNL